MANDIVSMTSTHIAGVFAANESRTSLENPNFNLQDASLWNQVFGGSTSTDAGIQVTKKVALECPPFWQAVQLIAGDAGMIPMAPYRRKTAEGRRYWEEDESHWTYSLVAIQANDDETSQDYWERTMADALVWGDGWGVIEWDGGERPSALYHLLPDRTKWATDENGRRYCATELGGKMRGFDPVDIIHISGLKPLGAEIPDFVVQARNTIAAFLSANAFTSKFFKHGGRAGGILQLPSSMPKPVQQQTEEGFRKLYEGGDDSFKTVILRDNAEFHAAQTSPRDVQAVESSERLARDVARFFGLPASMLNVDGGSSYNSKAEDGSGYVTHCLQRWLSKIAAQCRLRLLPQRERAATEYRHDTDRLFKMDQESRARAHATFISAKIKNPNDARIEEGLAPYKGGEEYSNPNTSSGAMQPAKPVDVEEPDDADETSKPEETTPKPKRTIASKRALIACTLAARHKSKKPNSFIDFVAKMERTTDWQIALGDVFDSVVDSVTGTDLVATVERLCGQFENIYLGD